MAGTVLITRRGCQVTGLKMNIFFNNGNESLERINEVKIFGEIYDVLVNDLLKKHICKEAFKFVYSFREKDQK